MRFKVQKGRSVDVLPLVSLLPNKRSMSIGPQPTMYGKYRLMTAGDAIGDLFEHRDYTKLIGCTKQSDISFSKPSLHMRQCNAQPACMTLLRTSWSSLTCIYVIVFQHANATACLVQPPVIHQYDSAYDSAACARPPAKKFSIAAVQDSVRVDLHIQLAGTCMKSNNVMGTQDI